MLDAMWFIRSAVLVLIFAPATLFADVTLRYKTDFQYAAFLPPAMTEQAMKQAQGQMFSGQSIRMKGSRGYSSAGKTTFLMDFAKEEVTLIDTENKRFATLPAKQFGDKMGNAMPDMPANARKELEAIKGKFDSRKTGRTDVIQGVQAEEREAVLSIDMPLPPGVQQSGPSMRMVMQIWTAKPEEVVRVPAVRELTGFQLWSMSFLNPASMIQKMFGKLPGFGDSFGSMFEDMSKNNTVMLRIRMEMYTPILAVMAKQLEKQGKPLPAGFDANVPMLTVTQEASELSSEAVDESIFRVPAEYQAAPAEEIMKSLLLAPTPPSK